MLQIIDISNQIMYNIVNGEKKLLAMINATVSHEMRNPLNSIYSQNIKHKELNDKLVKLITHEMDNLPVNEIKHRLKSFSLSHLECSKI